MEVRGPGQSRKGLKAAARKTGKKLFAGTWATVGKKGGGKDEYKWSKSDKEGGKSGQGPAIKGTPGPHRFNGGP